MDIQSGATSGRLKAKNKKQAPKPKNTKKKKGDGPTCSMFLAELTRKLAAKRRENQMRVEEEEDERNDKNVIRSIISSLTNALPVVFSRKSPDRLAPVNVETLSPELLPSDTLEVIVAPQQDDVSITEVDQPAGKRKPGYKIPKMPLASSDVIKISERRKEPAVMEDVAVNTGNEHDVATELARHVGTLRKISLIAEEFNQKTAKNLKEIVDSVQSDLIKKLEEIRSEQKAARESAQIAQQLIQEVEEYLQGKQYDNKIYDEIVKQLYTCNNHTEEAIVIPPRSKRKSIASYFRIRSRHKDIHISCANHKLDADLHSCEVANSTKSVQVARSAFPDKLQNFYGRVGHKYCNNRACGRCAARKFLNRSKNLRVSDAMVTVSESKTEAGPSMSSQKEYVVAFGHRMQINRVKSPPERSKVANKDEKKMKSKLPRCVKPLTNAVLGKGTARRCNEFIESGDTGAGVGTSKMVAKRHEPRGELKPMKSQIPRRANSPRDAAQKENHHQNQHENRTNNFAIEEQNVHRVQIIGTTQGFICEEKLGSLLAAKPIPTLEQSYAQGMRPSDRLNDWFMDSVGEYLRAPPNSFIVPPNDSNESNRRIVGVDNQENPEVTDGKDNDRAVYETTEETISPWFCKDNESGYRSLSPSPRDKVKQQSDGDKHRPLETKLSLDKMLPAPMSPEESEESNALPQHQSLIVAPMQATACSTAATDDASETDRDNTITVGTGSSKDCQFPSERECDSTSAPIVPSYVECPSEVLQKTTNFEIDVCVSEPRTSITGTDIEVREDYSNISLEQLDDYLEDLDCSHYKSQSTLTYASNSNEKVSYHDCWGRYEFNKIRQPSCNSEFNKKLQTVCNSHEFGYWKREICDRYFYDRHQGGHRWYCKDYEGTERRKQRFPGLSKRYNQSAGFHKLRRFSGVCRRRWQSFRAHTAGWLDCTHKRRNSRLRLMVYLQRSIILEDVDVQTMLLSFRDIGAGSRIMDQKSAAIATSLRLNSWLNLYKKSHFDDSQGSSQSHAFTPKYFSRGPSMFPLANSKIACLSANNADTNKVLSATMRNLLRLNSCPVQDKQRRGSNPVTSHFGDKNRNSMIMSYRQLDAGVEVSTPRSMDEKVNSVAKPSQISTTGSNDACTQMVYTCNSIDTNFVQEQYQETHRESEVPFCSSGIPTSSQDTKLVQEQKQTSNHERKLSLCSSGAFTTSQDRNFVQEQNRDSIYESKVPLCSSGTLTTSHDTNFANEQKQISNNESKLPLCSLGTLTTSQNTNFLGENKQISNNESIVPFCSSGTPTSSPDTNFVKEQNKTPNHKGKASVGSSGTPTPFSGTNFVQEQKQALNFKRKEPFCSSGTHTSSRDKNYIQAQKQASNHGRKVRCRSSSSFMASEDQNLVHEQKQTSNHKCKVPLCSSGILTSSQDTHIDQGQQQTFEQESEAPFGSSGIATTPQDATFVQEQKQVSYHEQKLPVCASEAFRAPQDTNLVDEQKQASIHESKVPLCSSGTRTSSPDTNLVQERKQPCSYERKVPFCSLGTFTISQDSNFVQEQKQISNHTRTVPYCSSGTPTLQKQVSYQEYEVPFCSSGSPSCPPDTNFVQKQNQASNHNHTFCSSRTYAISQNTNLVQEQKQSSNHERKAPFCSSGTPTYSPDTSFIQEQNQASNHDRKVPVCSSSTLTSSQDINSVQEHKQTSNHQHKVPFCSSGTLTSCEDTNFLKELKQAINHKRKVPFCSSGNLTSNYDSATGFYKPIVNTRGTPSRVNNDTENIVNITSGHKDWPLNENNLIGGFDKSHNKQLNMTSQSAVIKHQVLGAGGLEATTRSCPNPTVCRFATNHNQTFQTHTSHNTLSSRPTTDAPNSPVKQIEDFGVTTLVPQPKLAVTDVRVVSITGEKLDTQSACTVVSRANVIDSGTCTSKQTLNCNTSTSTNGLKASVDADVSNNDLVMRSSFNCGSRTVDYQCRSTEPIRQAQRAVSVYASTDINDRGTDVPVKMPEWSPSRLYSSVSTMECESVRCVRPVVVADVVTSLGSQSFTNCDREATATQWSIKDIAPVPEYVSNAINTDDIEIDTRLIQYPSEMQEIDKPSNASHQEVAKLVNYKSACTFTDNTLMKQSIVSKQSESCQSSVFERRKLNVGVQYSGYTFDQVKVSNPRRLPVTACVSTRPDMEFSRSFGQVTSDVRLTALKKRTTVDVEVQYCEDMTESLFPHRSAWIGRSQLMSVFSLENSLKEASTQVAFSHETQTQTENSAKKCPLVSACTSTYVLGETAVTLRDTAIPMRESAVSMRDLAVPMRESTIPMRDSPIPIRASADAMRNLAVPMQDSAISTRDSSIPTEVPMGDSAVAMQDPPVSVRGSAVPTRDSAVPMHYSAVAMQDPAAVTMRSSLVPQMAHLQASSAEPSPVESLQRRLKLPKAMSSCTARMLNRRTPRAMSVNSKLEYGHMFSLARLMAEKVSSARVIDPAHESVPSSLDADKWLQRSVFPEERDIQSMLDLKQTPSDFLSHTFSTPSKVFFASKKKKKPEWTAATPEPLVSPSKDSLADVLPAKEPENKGATCHPLKVMVDKDTSDDDAPSKSVKEHELQACPDSSDAATEWAAAIREQKSAAVLTSRCVLPAVRCQYHAHQEDVSDCVFVYDKPRCLVHKPVADVAVQIYPSHRDIELDTKSTCKQTPDNQSLGSIGSLVVPCIQLKRSSNVMGEVLSPKVYKALYETTKLVARESKMYAVKSNATRCTDNTDSYQSNPLKVSTAILTTPCSFDGLPPCTCNKRRPAELQPKPMISDEVAERLFGLTKVSAAMVTSHCRCDKEGCCQNQKQESKDEFENTDKNAKMEVLKKVESNNSECQPARLLSVPPAIESSFAVADANAVAGAECVRAHLVSSCRYYSELLQARIHRVRDTLKPVLPPTAKTVYQIHFIENATMKPSGRQELAIQTQHTLEKYLHHPKLPELVSCCCLDPAVSVTELNKGQKEKLRSVYYFLAAIEGRIRRLKSNLV